jgi:hypothetical protein
MGDHLDRDVETRLIQSLVQGGSNMTGTYLCVNSV